MADGRVGRLETTYWYLPSMNEASSGNFEFSLDTGSELGKQLREAHFAPVAFVTADHVSILVTPR